MYNIHRLAGVIDSSYRGNIKVCLTNLGNKPYRVDTGDRIIQAYIAPILDVEWESVDKLDDSDRGEYGFGSSGK